MTFPMFISLPRRDMGVYSAICWDGGGKFLTRGKDFKKIAQKMLILSVKLQKISPKMVILGIKSH